MPACLPACLACLACPACLPACLACLPCLPACLPALLTLLYLLYLLTLLTLLCPPARPLACLPACPLTYFTYLLYCTYFTYLLYLLYFARLPACLPACLPAALYMKHLLISPTISSELAYDLFIAHRYKTTANYENKKIDPKSIRPSEFDTFSIRYEISQYVNLLRNQCTTIGCRSCVNNDYTYSFVTCLWKSL